MPSSTPTPQQTSLVQSLFVQHSPALRGFIIALMPDFSRVDDVLQETFLTVTAKAAQFEPNTNFLAWATAIAKYKVLEALRAAGRQVPTFSHEVLESLCAVEPIDESIEPLIRHLTDCLGHLAPQARRAIELRYQQAHKPAEVARIMGWTAEAMYVALSRARNVLRECVERKRLAEAV